MEFSFEGIPLFSPPPKITIGAFRQQNDTKKNDQNTHANVDFLVLNLCIRVAHFPYMHQVAGYCTTENLGHMPMLPKPYLCTWDAIMAPTQVMSMRRPKLG